MELTLTKDLEILLVVAKSSCVENIIHSLKKARLESDVFWLKHPDKAIDFIESRGSYEGKEMTQKPKFFVFDASFGIEECKRLMAIVKSNDLLAANPFFVIAKNIPEIELEAFRTEGIYIIDENFKIDSLLPIPNPSSIFRC